MKIMRVVDKKVGQAYYYKYRVNIPKEAVRKSNLFGKKLKAIVKNGKIIIESED